MHRFSLAEVEALREALAAGEPPGMPEPLAVMLGRVRAALASEYPEQALDTLAAELAADPNLHQNARDALAAASLEAASVAAPLNASVAKFMAEAPVVEDAKARLLGVLDAGGVEGLSSTDAETVRRALAAIDPSALSATLSGLVGGTRDASQTLATAFQQLSGAPDASAAAVAPLREMVERLQQTGDAAGLEASLGSMREALAQLRAVAEARRPERAAQALVFEAVALDGVAKAGGDRRAAEERWRAALDAGEKAGELDVVARAALRLVAAATDAGEWGAVANLAARHRRVAETAKDEGQAVRAMLTEARALTNAGDHDGAEMRLLKARQRARAAGDATLLARVRLVAAGCWLAAGRVEDAEAEYEALLATLDASPGTANERARAALGLARCLTGRGEAVDRRSQALRMAADIGSNIESTAIFVPAVIGLAEAATELGDRVAAVAVLGSGKRRALEIGQEAAGQPFDEYLLLLQEQWGPEGLATALRAARDA